MAKKKGKYYESLPKEYRAKIDTFANNLRIFFPNQHEAALVFYCKQPTISRYANGVFPIPKLVAERFVKHTKGRVKLDAIWFDYDEYLRSLDKKSA